MALPSDWALPALGVARLEAWVEPDNEPSLRVLAAAGFAREGVLRSFLTLGGRRADAVVLSRIGRREQRRRRSSAMPPANAIAGWTVST